MFVYSFLAIILSFEHKTIESIAYLLN